MDILSGLNEKQLEAVTHFEGPMLVVAGAGSGKTRALTHRIAYLIREKGVSPWNILAVTFTNKAANEMRERVFKLMSDNNVRQAEDKMALYSAGDFENPSAEPLPTIGTFHSICVRILRKNIHLLDYENSFAIYDGSDQEILVKKIMEAMMIDPKKINPKAVLSHISNAKNQLIGPDEYSRYVNDYFSEKVAGVYTKYQNQLKQNNALDFDDLIMKTTEIFKNHPEVLSRYQEKFKYISVDEYQDTNKAQFVLINLLAERYRNLVVIGDSDQSIYGWRGASVQNILDFEKNYNDCKIVLLEQNYRSTNVILDASNAVISKNSARQEKKMWTTRESGDLIRLIEAYNERHEAEIIVNEIINISKQYETPNYNDIVILYRTNAQSRVIEEVFLRYGLPYRIIGGIKFYQRKEIKDIISYLRVLQNRNDSVSLLRIVNNPPRQIGPKTLETLQMFAIRNNISFYQAMTLASEISDLSPSKVEKINAFVALINKLAKAKEKYSASSVIKYVLENSGYKEMLDDGSTEGEARLENIRELISVANKYDTLEPGMSLSIFLEEISLIADVDSLDTKDNSVNLMTVHSAKGLEFPYVFIAGLEEGVFPHSRSMLDRMELEEERRLMYVAMTRAMDRLYLLYAKERTLYGEYKINAPSQFLDDIDISMLDTNVTNRKPKSDDNILFGAKPIPIEGEEKNSVETDFPEAEPAGFDVGDRVHHGIFGKGIVVNVIGGIATVAFEDPRVGVKKLALSIAPLKKI